MRFPAPWLALLSVAAAAQCVEIPGDRVRAGDIAGAVGAFAALPGETQIEIAPLPGVERRLTSAQLSRALGAPVATEVCVIRRARFLNVAEMEAALRKSLQDDQAKLAVLDFPRTPLPEGNLEFPRSGLSLSSSNAPAIWRGQIRQGEGRGTAVWAKVRISKPAHVVIARRTLTAGQALSAAEVEEKEVDYPSLNPPQINDCRKLGASEAAREIPAGTVIQPWMLRPKTAVRKGDLLRVSLESAAARLRFEAKAEFAARVGDRVLVRSPLNGKLVTAVIRGEGLAEIELDRAHHVKDQASPSLADPPVDEPGVHREAQGNATGSR